MENTKYGKRREGRWTPIRAKAQDTRANPNSWETHLVRKRWDIGLLRALSPRIMMMMTLTMMHLCITQCTYWMPLLRTHCLVPFVLSSILLSSNFRLAHFNLCTQSSLCFLVSLVYWISLDHYSDLI